VSDTDRLAALLCDLFPTAERSRWPFSVQMAAERLTAAGVTLAATPAPLDVSDCGAIHPEHPGTHCRRKPGHGGEHATARYDVTWDNAYLSAPEGK